MEHVVLIDTDSQLLRDISSLLRIHYANLDIACALDGKTGYELVQCLRPAFVILDLILPEWDGWSVLRRINANIYPVPRCIIYTDLDTPFLRKQMEQLGVQAFLNKDLPPPVLVQTIENYAPISLLEVEQMTAQVLYELGFAVRNKGYYYILEAVKICCQNRDALYHIVQQLYIPLAKLNGKSYYASERAIRHSIELAFDAGHPKWIQLFGKRERKPKNSEFLASVTEYVREKMKRKVGRGEKLSLRLLTNPPSKKGGFVSSPRETESCFLPVILFRLSNARDGFLHDINIVFHVRDGGHFGQIVQLFLQTSIPFR